MVGTLGVHHGLVTNVDSEEAFPILLRKPPPSSKSDGIGLFLSDSGACLPGSWPRHPRNRTESARSCLIPGHVSPTFGRAILKIGHDRPILVRFWGMPPRLSAAPSSESDIIGPLLSGNGENHPATPPRVSHVTTVWTFAASCCPYRSAYWSKDSCRWTAGSPSTVPPPASSARPSARHRPSGCPSNR